MSNPSVWMVLTAVIVFLVGVCVWGIFGHLDTVVKTAGECSGGVVTCYVKESDISASQTGMEITVDGKQGTVTDIEAVPVEVTEDMDSYVLEHVGRDNYQLFMDCAGELLKPGGLFLLHFISALKEYTGDPWIKKYIFPGGVVPSLREMLSCAAEDGFHTIDVENLRLHYNRTLLCWERNYKEHIRELRKMFDGRFTRMWDLYLSACAATFHNGVIDIEH